MKIRVNRDVLADAVAWTSRVLPVRPAMPVLSGLLLEAEAEDLTLSAFDFEVSAQATIEAEVAAPGRVLVPGRVLAEITKSLPDRPVELHTTASEAVLTCGSTEFALLTMAVEDYPALPPMPPRTGVIGGGIFATAVGQVAPAASRDDTLPMLTGIRMEIDDVNVALAATDRYRIAARDFLWHPDRPGVKAAAMIPARVLVEAARSLRAGEVAIAIGETVAGFAGIDRRTTVRLLDEQFIDYRSRLTEDWPIRAELPVAPFIEAVRRVTLVADRNAAVRLSFSPGQVLVQAGGGDLGRGAEVVPAELEGADIQIAFQPGFLLDGLAGVETERVRMHLASPTRPALITNQGEGSAYRYLVMSLRLG